MRLDLTCSHKSFTHVPERACSTTRKLYPRYRRRYARVRDAILILPNRCTIGRGQARRVP